MHFVLKALPEDKGGGNGDLGKIPQSDVANWGVDPH